MSVLSANKLGKSYQSRRVVDDVSLTVQSGQVVGLLGPNGAGKTTCFYMIVGLVPCDEGSIVIDDIDLTDQPVHLRALHGLGYLPQEASVFRNLSVADNIMAVLEIREDLDKAARIELLTDLLRDLHIEHLVDQPAISLSGGNGDELKLPAHWQPIRALSCWTSRLPVLTRSLLWISSKSSGSCVLVVLAY